MATFLVFVFIVIPLIIMAAIVCFGMVALFAAGVMALLTILFAD